VTNHMTNRQNLCRKLLTVESFDFDQCITILDNDEDEEDGGGDVDDDEEEDDEGYSQ